MPLPSLNRTILTRALVSTAVLTGLAGAFVAGTSYGGGSGGAGPDPHRGSGGADASPAAYSGSDLSLAGSCDELLDWYV
jgi:hypothetical protein